MSAFPGSRSAPASSLYRNAASASSSRWCSQVSGGAPAEEVLQETFFEVCRSIGRYREEGSLWGWVRSIAASKALMRLRRNKYRDTDELHDEVTGHRRGEGHPR